MPAFFHSKVYRSFCLPAISGLLLCLSFPSFLSRSFSAWPGWLAWISLVPLFASLEGSHWRQAFWRGYVCGFISFLFSLYWICYVRPMGIFASVGWVCLAAFLALYPAAFSALMRLGWQKYLAWPGLWVPALWTALEYLRGGLLSGFPWNGLGNSQYRCLWLLPIAAAFGVYGLHYLVCYGNLLIYRLFFRPVESKRKLLWQACLVGLFFGLLGFANRFQPKTVEQQVKVAVIQGNINQDQEWTPAYRAHLMEVYLGLMEKAVKAGAKLLVWPEGSFPGFFDPSLPEAKTLIKFAQSRQVDLLIGSDSYDRQKDIIGNSAILIGADGSLQEYRKQHLVPFGEFIPCRKWFPFLDKAIKRFGMEDFTPGLGPVAFKTQAGLVAPLICYESIFPGLARRAQTLPAMLAVITFDTWYGDSAAPYQHASLAVMRAVENRCWLARAGATGISCFISPRGEITQAVGLNQEGFALEETAIYAQRTLYQRWGDWFVFVCLGLMIGLALQKTAQEAGNAS